MRNKNRTLKFITIGLLAMIVISSCSRNPLRHRLAQNFIYNCALGLIEEGVTPMEADQICRSAHASELQEGQIKNDRNKELANESKETALKITDAAKSSSERAPASKLDEKQ